MTRWTTRIAIVFLFAAVCSFVLAEDKQGEKANDSPVAASVKVELLEPMPIGTDWKWNKMPAFLTGASIYEKAKGEPKSKLQYEVLKDGVLVMAASWTYDGNPSGGWMENRWTDKMVTNAGWQPIGEMVRINRDKNLDPHVIFRKVVKAGEKVELHTRKYNAPLIILPAADRVQEVLAAKIIKVAPMDVAAARYRGPPEKIVDYQDRAEDKGVLVGFRVTIDSLARERRLGSLQPIYETSEGRTPGKIQGALMGNAVEVQAKPGYVVGGLTLSKDTYLTGFSVTFVRRTETGLDRNEAYSSRWIGDQTENSEVCVDIGEQPFVGVRGKVGNAIRTIELIAEKP